jgi:chromosome segregation ATPase
MIQAEEDSLGKAKNEFVKKSIQARIDALKADLEAALPEALKDEVETELPTPEESGLEDAAENKEEKDEEVKESLNEEVRDLTKIKGTYSKLISDNIQQIFDALEQRKSTSEMKELVLNIIESAHDTPAKRGFIVKLNKQSSAFGIANLCKNAMLAADKDTRLNK